MTNKYVLKWRDHSIGRPKLECVSWPPGSLAPTPQKEPYDGLADLMNQVREIAQARIVSDEVVPEPMVSPETREERKNRIWEAIKRASGG